jgi:uncharacterized RDD family membrane protein YckC
MNEQLTIGTPENVSFGYPIAGIGSRFVAALVDSSLIVLLQLVVYLTIFLALMVMSGSDLEAQATALVGLEGWLLAGLSLLSFIFLWGYYIFFELLWNGQSPGKRLVKLRVVRSDGGAIAITESIIRNLIRFIDFLPIAYGFGVATMFVNAQSRRLGDLAAGTLVVHDRLAVTLDSLRRRPFLTHYRYGQDTLSPVDLPLHRLSPADLQIAQEFLLREKELAPRDQLANQIVQFLYGKMEQAPPALARGQAAAHLAAILQQAAEMEQSS